MTHADVAMSQRNIPTSFNVRRFAILLQLAFVGLLLVGRVAASLVDASVAPAYEPANVTGPARAG